MANQSKPVYEITNWDGKRSSFPSHCKEVLLFVGSNTSTFIIDAARALFAYQQLEAGKARAVGGAYSLKLSDADPDDLKDALQAARVTARMAVIRATILKETFGGSWTKRNRRDSPTGQRSTRRT